MITPELLAKAKLAAARHLTFAPTTPHEEPQPKKKLPRGVCLSSSGKPYQVSVYFQGRSHHIGHFNRVEDAEAAYIEAKARFAKMVNPKIRKRKISGN